MARAETELADKVGVTAAAICNWETGAIPKGVNKSKLEDVLGHLSSANASKITNGLADGSRAEVLDDDVSSFGVRLRNQRLAARL